MTVRQVQSAESTQATVAATPGGARFVVQAWLASRALIALVALLLAVTTGRTVTDMVSNWDVQHFSRLAAGGYLADADGTLMAFFPGFPSLLSLGLWVGVPVAVTGPPAARTSSTATSPRSRRNMTRCSRTANRCGCAAVSRPIPMR